MADPADSTAAATVRDATIADAQAIADIYAESVAAGDSTMDRVPWTTQQVVDKLQAQTDRLATLVLEAAGRVVGWAMIKQYSERLGYRTCCETSIYLRRSETGRGFGRRLVAAQLERCQRLGYHHIVARIFAENTGSVRFHEQHGFELVGVQKEIGSVDGRWIDVAILQKVFAGSAPHTSSQAPAGNERSDGPPNDGPPNDGAPSDSVTAKIVGDDELLDGTPSAPD
ncbi:MAG: N-acetyltransferase family protein [Planctomycetota bacterium]